MSRASISLGIGRFAAAAACCIPMVQPVSAAPADPFLAAVANMKKSIAAVACVRPHAEHQRFAPMIVGTAFFTSRSGEFLTAAHVIRLFRTGELQTCPMEVWFSQGPQEPGHVGFQMFPVSRCITDDRDDVARCVTIADLSTLTDVKFKPQAVTIDASPRPDGTPIAVTGYPLSTMLPITSRGYIGASQVDELGQAEIILDRAAWPGGSGSPVYDSTGKVLGLICQAGEGVASGISFARASSSIISFLAKHPLPPAPDAPSQSAPPSSPPQPASASPANTTTH